MKQKIAIFDFDGTIADTLDAVVNIYNKIASKYNCKEVREEDRKKLQAKKPQEFLKDYGLTNFKLPFVLLKIRRGLKSEIENIKPIKGMVQTLKDIKNAGFVVGVMTSNSKENVESFFKLHDLNGIFDFIYSGKNLFGKDKVLKRLLKKHKIDKEIVVYIGDETRDIEAAKKVGMPVVAVSWGFNSKEILVSQMPNAIVDEPEKLLNVLESFC